MSFLLLGNAGGGCRSLERRNVEMLTVYSPRSMNALCKMFTSVSVYLMKEFSFFGA